MTFIIVIQVQQVQCVCVCVCVRARVRGRVRVLLFPVHQFFLSVQELVLYHRSEPITLQSGGVTCLTQPCRR